MMIWGNLVTLALPSYQWQCFCARSVPGMRKVAIHPAALVWNHDGPGILLLWKLWTTICEWPTNLTQFSKPQNYKHLTLTAKNIQVQVRSRIFLKYFYSPPPIIFNVWQGFQFDQATCHFWISLLILTDLACTSVFCLKQTDDHHHPDSWLWRRRSSW